MVKFKRLTIPRAGKNAEKLEPSDTVGRSLKCYNNNFEKQFLGVLKFRHAPNR